MEISEEVLQKIKDVLCPEEDCKCERDIRIVILQRGWVMVGEYVISEDGIHRSLLKGYNIRNWGTTRGLGEIAMNGPTDKTVLDPVPEVEFHELTEIASLKCKESKWKKLIK